MSERTPFTGTTGKELYPSRLDSPIVQTAEKIVAVVTTLLAVATVIVCIVEGMRFHTEHILMGGLVGLSCLQTLWVGRLYLQDVIQNRWVIYYGLVVTILACATGLLYATSWQKVSSNPFGNCAAQDFYSRESHVCASLPPYLSSTNSCAILGSVDKYAWSFNYLFFNNNISNVSCTDVQNALIQCYGSSQEPLSWTCPNEETSNATIST